MMENDVSSQIKKENKYEQRKNPHGNESFDRNVISLYDTLFRSFDGYMEIRAKLLQSPYEYEVI